MSLDLTALQNRLKEKLRISIQERFAIVPSELYSEIPPRSDLGDLAFPVAFELVKALKKQTGRKVSPREISENLKTSLDSDPAVTRVEVTPNGYINVFFDRPAFLEGYIDELASAKSRPANGAKRIVEHTNINPNKAAHIGHLRNAVLGDTLVRVMREQGEVVEVQNYIDNTGVQVADVVVGFLYLEGMSLTQLKQFDERLPAGTSFDYYCWDLYARVGLFYRHEDPKADEDPERLKLRAKVLHSIEAGQNEIASIAEYISNRIVEHHLETMLRLGITYDLLPRESEILHLHFWERAFELLRNAQAVRLERGGRHDGCWVMPIGVESQSQDHEADKIIVRSDGTVTYSGKDIAYQLWKLGRLGLDFFYRPFRTYAEGHTVWATTSEYPAAEASGAEGQKSHPAFGSGQTVYNVIDSRQSYTQDVVRQGVRSVCPEIAEEASVHISYEMVALSPSACQELGIELQGDDLNRSHIEMSGRRGLGVKADDLINRLEKQALREVNARHPDLSLNDRTETAHIIAVGALRYFLLKWTRSSVISFDFKEALSFEGETGPYCQYAAVRANSIFRKLGEQEVATANEIIVNEGNRDQLMTVMSGDEGNEIWSLLLLAARRNESVRQAKLSAEPSSLAKYSFQLARAFNLFYHRHRIISEENPIRRAVLISVAAIARQELSISLDILGIAVPERM